MNKENLSMEQRAKNAAKSNKSQVWKKAVLSTLGLATAGVAAAAILHHDPEPEPIEPIDDPTKADADKDVVVVGGNSHTGNSHGHSHISHHDDDVSLPDYLVYNQEVVTLENGGQMEVAWGVTENGRDCVIIDDDMDGKANRFIEDINDDGLVENAETINLADNDIVVSMEHLPSLDVTVVVPDTTDNDIAYVVDADPNVNIDADDQIDIDFNPEYNTTDSYDVASNDDVVADPNDNIMA